MVSISKQSLFNTGDIMNLIEEMLNCITSQKMRHITMFLGGPQKEGFWAGAINLS